MHYATLASFELAEHLKQLPVRCIVCLLLVFKFSLQQYGLKLPFFLRTASLSLRSHVIVQ